MIFSRFLIFANPSFSLSDAAAYHLSPPGLPPNALRIRPPTLHDLHLIPNFWTVPLLFLPDALRFVDDSPFSLILLSSVTFFPFRRSTSSAVFRFYVVFSLGFSVLLFLVAKNFLH